MLFIRMLFMNPAMLAAIAAAAFVGVTMWTTGWYNKGVRKANQHIIEGNLSRQKLVNKFDRQTSAKDLEYEREEADIDRRYRD
jgi:cell division protein FtsX